MKVLFFLLCPLYPPTCRRKPARAAHRECQVCLAGHFFKELIKSLATMIVKSEQYCRLFEQRNYEIVMVTMIE